MSDPESILGSYLSRGEIFGYGGGPDLFTAYADTTHEGAEELRIRLTADLAPATVRVVVGGTPVLM